LTKKNEKEGTKVENQLKKVFWFTGRAGAGKTTLTKKLESHIKNKTKILRIDGNELRSEIKSNSGILLRLYLKSGKQKMRMMVVKNAVEQANRYSQSDVTVLIAIVGSQKISDYAKKQLNGRYREIYLECSKECAFKRRHLSRAKKPHEYFEEPKSSNIIIDTEHQSVEESFQTLLHFIEKEQANIHDKTSLL